jgi:hypothetical protein
MAIKRFTIGLTWTSDPEHWQEINRLLSAGWQTLDIATYTYDGEMSQDWTLFIHDNQNPASENPATRIPANHPFYAPVDNDGKIPLALDKDTAELSPAIRVAGGTVFVNPGTGVVSGATEQHAIANIQAFIQDCVNRDSALTGMAFFRTPETDYGDGRYGFDLLWQDKTVEIQMPGWELERVRFTGAEGQNILNFPRLYVDGNSWAWKFAINCTVGAFTEYGEDDSE